MTTIKLQNLTKTFGSGSSTVAAVDHVDLTIDSGEFYFLLGPSGCGKTTLLRIIAGMVEPTAGRVRFDDRDVTDVPVEKRKTAMVFQNYALWPHMTVAENVKFGPRMQNLPRHHRQALAQQNLTRIQMAQYSQRRPNQLSGGQQQRVALARALAAQPDVLLLDEPLSNLDAQLRLHMRTELLQLVKSTGMTAVYVTHDQQEALSMADRIAVINQGKVIQIGRPEQIYQRPVTRFIANFIGEANIIAGRIENADRIVQIKTPAGPFFACDPQNFTAGQSVGCCVRPERITLNQSPPPASDTPLTSLPAIIHQSIYLGQSRQYLCQITNGDT